MLMKIFVLDSKWLLLVLMACFPVALQAARPNFVVIIADDLGGQDLAAYGHPVIKTPHIDQLARAGLQFNNAFLTTSSCTASRASILTGRYPHSSGAPHLGDAVPADQRLVSSYLRDSGYYTASVGKWHLGDQVVNQFDLVTDPPGDSGADGWVQALRQRPQDKPFFFWFASKDPHMPYSDLPANGLYQAKDSILQPSYLDTPGTRMNIAQYYTEVSRLDSYVGDVLKELAAQHLLENTYVIFLSDNGAPMPRAKTTLYDAGTRTPLIIRGPGVAAGLQTSALISSVDVMPTVLALAGLPSASAMQGISFRSLLDKPGTVQRDLVFMEQHNHGYRLNRYAVRGADYLYIRNVGINEHGCLLELQPMGQDLVNAFRRNELSREQLLCFQQEVPEEELYDVRRDPLQFHNLASDLAMVGVMRNMRKAMDEQAVKTADVGYLQATGLSAQRH